MEFLTEKNRAEYEAFCISHPNSVFTQSLKWPSVKNNWQSEGIISRDENGKVRGVMLILIQYAPLFKSAFLYAPRGPVCDYHDVDTLKDLFDGVKVLAKKYNAYTFKCDPDILLSDEKFIGIMKDMGFSHNTGGEDFETIQARFNYRLYINGRNEEELMANLHPKTRYNIRVALKHEVEVKVCDKSALDEFLPIMQVTGERDGFSTRPRAYFERMLDSLGENVRLYMAYYQGKAVSGAITTQYGNKTCYVYGASDNNHRNVMPNYLVQWEMIKWALENNCDVYDFQGVSGNLDENSPHYGLYRFKKGFNGQLDELAGEFDYNFKPLLAKTIDKLIDLKEALHRKKRK